MRGYSTGRRRRMSLTRTAAAMVAGALLLTAAFAPASMAAAPTPNAGTATIDGTIGDWSLSADFFADMTDGGVAGRPVRAKLYLKYDCDTETLAALVLIQGDEKARQTRTDNAYINIDGSKVIDSTHGSFAWVNGDGTLADGYEGAAGLAPGSYTLRAHVLVADDSEDGYTPLDNVGRFVPLVIECGGVQPTQGTTGLPRRRGLRRRPKAHRPRRRGPRRPPRARRPRPRARPPRLATSCRPRAPPQGTPCPRPIRSMRAHRQASVVSACCWHCSVWARSRRSC